MDYRRDIDRFITNRALELSDKMSESEIASTISDEIGVEISRNVVHGRLYRRKNTSGLEHKPRPAMPYFERYAAYYKRVVAPQPKYIPEFNVAERLKILVLNDLHTPFQHESALEQALTENHSADIVIASEISDMYSVSPFSKSEHVSFETEVEEIIRLYEYFSAKFPHTVIISGSHEKRLAKFIANKIPTELLFLIETDLLSYLAMPFPNVIVENKPFYSINDALFTHINKHSSVVPMRSAHKTHEWVQNWKTHFKIPEYSVLVQAHSHHSGLYNLPTVQLIETGCLQRPPQWILDRVPMLPWVHGYCVVHQVNGVTDLNSTELKVYRG